LPPVQWQSRPLQVSCTQHIPFLSDGWLLFFLIFLFCHDCGVAITCRCKQHGRWCALTREGQAQDLPGDSQVTHPLSIFPRIWLGLPSSILAFSSVHTAYRL
jgi:hypothetical protein